MAKQETPLEGSTVSTVLTVEEILQIKNLCDLTGVSVSHICRALLRVGIASINKSTSIDKTLLRLVKLGK